MGNEDRRGGIGFGNQRRVDAGARVEQDEESVESTRAMDIDDLAPAPTEYVRSAPPVPPPPASRPARPGPVARRPAPPPPPPLAEEEQATRMLDAMDFDPADMPGHAPAAPPLRVMELRVVSGPDRGKVHRIELGDSLVGRGLDCQIVLADPAVSRKHFKIERSPDESVLVDLGGANGTNINGQRRARQVLEQGDHIEIGTSVLEFHLEGAAPRRRDGRGAAQPERGAAAEARPAGKTNVGLVIAAIAAVLVVLAGGAVAAWLVLGKDGDPAAQPSAPAAAEDDSEVGKLVAKAKGLLADGEFSAALDILKEARKLDRENQDVRDLIRSAQKEIDAQEVLDDARQAVKAGQFDVAFRRFAEIGDSSVLHAEAQEELGAAREAFFSARMADAKKANESGDVKAATAALDAILALDPQRAEAKAMRATLDSAPAAGEPAPVKPAVEAGKPTRVAEPKVAIVAPAPVAAASAKKADFTAGLAAYHGRNWSAAIQAFEAIAAGPYAKDQKAKAAGYAGAVKSVQDELNAASGAASNPRKAASAYKAAYNADRRVDGHHGSYFASKLAESFLALAKSSFAAKNYADSADAVRESLNYQPDKPEAVQLEARCMQQASAMLKEAKDHMAKKNYAMARDLARQVVRILPSMDPRSTEAQAIAKQATEAFRQDED